MAVLSVEDEQELRHIVEEALAASLDDSVKYHKQYKAAHILAVHADGGLVRVRIKERDSLPDSDYQNFLVRPGRDSVDSIMDLIRNRYEWA